MKHLFKVVLALHASLAYLGMLTGFGMVLSSALFVHFLVNTEISIITGLFSYFLFVVGPCALLLTAYFFTKMRQRTV